MLLYKKIELFGCVCLTGNKVFSELLVLLTFFFFSTATWTPWRKLYPSFKWLYCNVLTSDNKHITSKCRLQLSLTFDLQYGIPFYLQYLAHWPEYFIVAEAPGGELMGYSEFHHAYIYLCWFSFEPSVR